jgi:hypothetical protein
VTRAEAMTYAISILSDLARDGDIRAVDALAALAAPKTSHTSAATIRQQRYRARVAAGLVGSSVDKTVDKASTETSTKASTEPSTGSSFSSSDLISDSEAKNAGILENLPFQLISENARPADSCVDVDARRVDVDERRKKSAAISAVYGHWLTVMGKDPNRTKLTGDRERKIRARLADGYSVDDLKAAIDGCRLSPWHMGDNDRGTPVNDIEQICRGGRQTDDHIARLCAPQRAGAPRSAAYTVLTPPKDVA